MKNLLIDKQYAAAVEQSLNPIKIPIIVQNVKKYFMMNHNIFSTIINTLNA